MNLFISHATDDKPLIDAFVDLLQTGMDIRQDAIFCSSLQGHGIPEGTNFIEWIKSKLNKANFVISVITPRYYESAFCFCELGATWALGSNFFPILVPPIDYGNMKAVLVGIQSGPIDSKDLLNNLRDRLIASGLQAGSTAKWESKRDTFLIKCPTMLKQLKQASVISAAQYQQLKDTYAAAQETIGTQEETVDKLKKQIAELEKCKDKAQVQQVKANFSTKEQQFKRLTATASEALTALPSVVSEAIFQIRVHKQWHPSSDFSNDQTWENIYSAKDRNMLVVAGSDVKPDMQHPKVERAINAVNQLSTFLEEADESFHTDFKQQHDYPLSLDNKDFWKDFLS